MTVTAVEGACLRLDEVTRAIRDAGFDVGHIHVQSRGQRVTGSDGAPSVALRLLCAPLPLAPLQLEEGSEGPAGGQCLYAFGTLEVDDERRYRLVLQEWEAVEPEEPCL